MSYADLILANSPTNYFPLTNSNLTDSITGSVLTASSLPSIETGAGPDGENVFDFNGTSNYLSTNNSNLFYNSTSGYGMEFLFRNKKPREQFLSMSDSVCLFDRFINNGYWGLRISLGEKGDNTYSNTLLRINVQGALNTGFSYNSEISPQERFYNQWNHLYINNFESSQYHEIYLNGMLIYDVNHHGPITSPTSAPQTIGCAYDITKFFKGNICHLAFYNKPNIVKIEKIFERSRYFGIIPNSTTILEGMKIGPHEKYTPNVVGFVGIKTLEEIAYAPEINSRGSGTISGVVQTNVPPLENTFTKICLIRRRDMRFVAETMSDPVSGFYKFENYDKSEDFMVLGVSKDENFNSVILDRIRPE